MPDLRAHFQSGPPAGHYQREDAIGRRLVQHEHGHDGHDEREFGESHTLFPHRQIQFFGVAVLRPVVYVAETDASCAFHGIEASDPGHGGFEGPEESVGAGVGPDDWVEEVGVGDGTGKKQSRHVRGGGLILLRGFLLEVLAFEVFLHYLFVLFGSAFHLREHLLLLLFFLRSTHRIPKSRVLGCGKNTLFCER